MTQPMHDYRYTDRDVREDPRLEQLVVAYVQQYGGDFEPVLNAKRKVASGGEMPTAMVRVVLNCMRYDYNVADKMPVPSRPFFIVPEHPRRRVTVPEPPKVHYPFDLKVKWKMPYIAATHKQAKAYHLLDPVKSSIRYYPSIKEFQPRMRPYCSAVLSTGVMLAEPPDDRYLCNSCARIKSEIETREAERQNAAIRLRGECHADS